MRKKLLLTGGSGNLAPLVTESLLPSHDVYLLDIKPPGQRLGDMAEKVYEMDVQSSELSGLFEQIEFDLVVNCAASFDDPTDWQRDIQTNVRGAANLAKAASGRVRRVLNVQTVLIHGDPGFDSITPNTITNPTNSYAISKLAGEDYLSLGHYKFTSIRLASVVSPGLDIGPIPAFYKRISAGEKITVSETRRDFLDHRDFMRGIELIFAQDDLPRNVTFGTGKSNSMRTILENVAGSMSVDLANVNFEVVPPSSHDVRDVAVSSDFVRSLGWDQKFSLDQTVSDTVKFYGEHGLGGVRSHL